MQNSVFNPTHIDEFDKTKLNFDAKGVTASITAGTSQNIDLTLTDDHLITGAWMIVDGATLGDTVNLQVVDTTGFTGYPAGTVLNQFITNFYLPTSASEQFNITYPAKIIAGLTLRVVYTSTGATNPFFAANFYLHKILV